jgi:hypothetical protein
MSETTETSSNGNFSLQKKVFNDLNFIEAMRELSKQPLSIKVAWNVNRIIKQAQEAIDKGQKEVQAILKDHVNVDEKGKFKINPETQDLDFKDKAAFDEIYGKMMEESVTFKSYKLDLNVLEAEGVKLSALQLSYLEPVILQ